MSIEDIYVPMSPEDNCTPIAGKVSKTLVVIVLDESASMGPKKGETLSGFNEFISQQKVAAPGDQALVYLITFNSHVKVVHKGMALDKFPLLTDKDYRPSGYTALYDAVAEGIRLGRGGKHLGDRVVCMIVTDGEENSSRKTSRQQMSKMMAECEATGEWTFAYIGVNVDDWVQSTGTSWANTSPYNHVNSRENYAMMNAGLSRLRLSNQLSTRNIFMPD